MSPQLKKAKEVKLRMTTREPRMLRLKFENECPQRENSTLLADHHLWFRGSAWEPDGLQALPAKIEDCNIRGRIE
jgi:hypothetical protein